MKNSVLFELYSLKFIYKRTKYTLRINSKIKTDFKVVVIWDIVIIYT